jgi:transposase
VETIGNWYWIVDEIEEARMVPRLVHARRAKMMRASVNKTDKLDCHGLNRLQQTGTLPTVWIAPAAIRDLRELPRTRMAMSRDRTKAKNRIHAILAKYGIRIEGVSDIFGLLGRQKLSEGMKLLPPHSQFAMQVLLAQLEAVQQQITLLEGRMKESFAGSRELELLQSLPGVGFILAVVILLEAGNVICLQHARYPYRHVSQLYLKVRQRRGHQKAVGAVARHLAEATWWMLKKGQAYQEPKKQAVLSTKG